MLNRFSNKIADVLCLESKQRVVISYGLKVLFYNLTGLLAVLIAACFLRVVIPTLWLVVVLLLLRPSAGGAHCSNAFNCNLFGFIFIPLLGYGAAWLSNCSIIINYLYLALAGLIALFGISLNAPYFTQSKPRAEVRRKKLKGRSLIMTTLIVMVAAAFLYLGLNDLSMGMATGLLFQGMMLLPPGLKITGYLDNLLNIVFLKKGR